MTYLNAALGSIAARAKVSVRAEYSSADGMREATESYLRNKGYSRIVLRDPVSGASFDKAYCAHDSKAFEDLIGVHGKKVFIFECERGTGENRRPALFIESLLAVRQQPEAIPPTVQAATFRVTLTDAATSNRTVLANVELGREYSVAGVKLKIESESAAPVAAEPADRPPIEIIR